jgi:hypothetical protein
MGGEFCGAFSYAPEAVERCWDLFSAVEEGMRKRIPVQAQFEETVPKVEVGHATRRHTVVLSTNSHNVKGKGHPKAFDKRLQSGYFQIPEGQIAVAAGCP